MVSARARVPIKWSTVGLLSPGQGIDPLHKQRLNLNNNTHTSIASHSCENFFVLKHDCEAKDVLSIVIQI